MNTLSFKGYTAKIEFDPDDNILFGNIIGIQTVAMESTGVYWIPACDTAIEAQLDRMESKGDKEDLPPTKKQKTKSRPGFDVTAVPRPILTQRNLPRFLRPDLRLYADYGANLIRSAFLGSPFHL